MEHFFKFTFPTPSPPPLPTANRQLPPNPADKLPNEPNSIANSFHFPLSPRPCLHASNRKSKIENRKSQFPLSGTSPLPLLSSPHARIPARRPTHRHHHP